MKTFPWDEIGGHIERDPKRAENISRHRQEAIQEIVAYQLSELRKAVGVTQTEIANSLGLSQSSISKLEGRRHAEKLSVIREYIEALGGRLELAAVFDGTRIVLRGFNAEDEADSVHGLEEVQPAANKRQAAARSANAASKGTARIAPSTASRRRTTA